MKQQRNKFRQQGSMTLLQVMAIVIVVGVAITVAYRLFGH